MLRNPTLAARHPWTFFRAGNLDQVYLRTAEDLLALPSLDQKLWVALSCPIKGIHLDARTLALVDFDHDGFIRVPEVLHAVEWAAARVKDPARLLRGESTLPIDSIVDSTPEDRAIIASAREILKRLGKSDAAGLAPEDFADREKIFPPTALNGDGVITPSETDDPAIQQLIKDVIAGVGAEKGRSGAEGVTPERVDAFFTELQSYLDWIAKSSDKEIAVLGDRTAAACTATSRIRAKVDDYFARCRLAAFDTRAIAALNRQESEYLAIAAKDLQVTSEEIAAFPLARVAAEGVLPLFSGSNPAWSAVLADFHRDAVAPIFGADKRSLTEEEWRALNARLAPFEAWLGSKAGGSLEQLGVDRAKAIVASDVRAKLSKLFAEDKELQPHYEGIAAVERLVYYHRDLRTLLHNFVNFADFFTSDRWAVFQAGKLYLDQRACELCIRVDDPAAHALLATMSRTYIAYLDCRRENELVKLAACFTQGDSDYLFLGRNGVFYDRNGDDWQATIIKIIDSPISLRQAFWSPYKKVIRAVEEQVAKRAAAAESAEMSQLTAAAIPAPGAPATPVPHPVAASVPRRLDLSSIIGLSVAIGSIGTFLATIFAKFVDLPAWEIPLIVIVLMLVVSLPSVVISWLKLRQRNLGPILEANGWAINGRVKINVPFGAALTERAKLPKHSRVILNDPYSGRHPVRTRIIVYATLAVLLIAAVLFARHQGTWPYSPWWLP